MRTSSTVSGTSVTRADLTVRPITRDEHLAFVEKQSETEAPGKVSFLQAPSWADVKIGWRAEYLGWFEGPLQVGAGLVLGRRFPGSRRFFAYVPDGPLLALSRPDLDEQIRLLLECLKDIGAFAVRMGPPLEARRWSAATLKSAVGPGRRVGDVDADHADALGAQISSILTDAGWRRCAETGDAQPRLLFTVPMAERDSDDLWQGLNQGWRRHIRRATAEGVTVSIGGRDDIPVFYDLVRATEERNGFRLGRTLAYYQRQYDALNAERPDRMRLYLARHGDDILAAHNLVILGRRVWYLAGGSSMHERKTGASHALQWRMISDAHELGAAVYDMRGVPGTLDPADREFGLMRWKLGTGGDLVETVGEWEIGLPGLANRALYRSLRSYLSHR